MIESEPLIDEHIVQQVVSDNIADQQIGTPESNDGISDRAARDIGYGEVVDHLEGEDTLVVSKDESLPDVPPPVERARPYIMSRSTPASTRRLFELPGRDGKTNFSGPPRRRDIVGGLSQEEVDRRKAAAHKGFGEALAILRNKKTSRG